MGWEDMLPLDALGTDLLGSDQIAARGQVHTAARGTHPVKFASTVEVTFIITVMIDILAHLNFGAIEVIRCCLDANGDQQDE
jgi:hypothetical protein